MDDLTRGANADELAGLRESVADVLANECGRRRVHDFVDGKDDLEAALWGRARELGWLAVGLPEAHGGLGLGARGLAVLHRELGRQLAPGAFISTLSAAQALAQDGMGAGPELLQRVAGGEAAVCVPATPLEAGATGLRLASGTLNGSASELLGTPGAGLALLPVREDAWALVAVDGRAAKLHARRLWDQTRSFCTLDCAGAEPAALIEGEAARRLRESLGLHMALALCFDSIGAGDAILRQTIDYMQGRTQFGRTIASFQALKHRVARLKVEWELARHAAAQALQAAEASSPDRFALAALAKATVTEAFAFIAGECVQLHGGGGYTWEFDCHLFLKRARLNESLVARNDEQLDASAARFAEATRAGHSMLELPL